MSWLVVARKEFEDAVRSRMLWAIVVVVTLMAGVSAGLSRLVPGAEPTALAGLAAAAQFSSLLVPILSLVAAYLAVAGERESGSLKVLLGLPPSRAAVFAGKFLGRSSVVAAGVTAGFVAVGGITFALYGTVPVVAYLGTAALTVAFGIVFVGIAVGISAATSTRSRAMTLAIGVYLVVVLFWDLFAQVTHLLVTGSMPGATVPAWFLLLQGLGPAGAYNAVAAAVIRGGDATAGFEAVVDGPVPAYLDTWVFAAVLLTWLVVPLALGYRSFERADLS